MNRTQRKDIMPHTPGPWKVIDGEIIAESAVLGMVYGADDYPCCPETDDITDECKANARLIEKAPTLLADLETVVKLCDSLIEQITPSSLERILDEHNCNATDYILNTARADIAEIKGS